jgi:hypothetical protein
MSVCREFTRYVAASLALAAGSTQAVVTRADPASPRSAEVGQSVPRGGRTTDGRGAGATAAEPARIHFGHAELYVPTLFCPVAGNYDLVVHFHGMPVLQEENFERAHLNAVVVSVNMGISSDAYANAFRAPGSFDTLLRQAQSMLEGTGRAPGARLGRIALTAWSAGFASIAAIFNQPGVADRIDAVLLADGPHTNYVEPHRVNDGALAKWARLAEAAMRGEKLFALTHSSIPTVGYPSTTETVSELLDLVSVDKVPTGGVGPRGMHPIYASHSGDFHVEGFEGQTVKDHIDHIKGMSETLLPYLRERWAR